MPFKVFYNLQYFRFVPYAVCAVVLAADKAQRRVDHAPPVVDMTVISNGSTSYIISDDDDEENG
jgi:hypothetical protein